jgi:hypothetical protein
MKKNTYFANLPIDEIASALHDKIKQNEKYVLDQGFLNLWRNSMFTYTKNGDRLGTIPLSGSHGEYSNLGVNHYRNLISHIVSMTTQQKPSFEPVATNTDYKSQSQTIVARSLLEYYMNEKKLDRITKQAVQYAILYGEGYVKVEWDAQAGEVYDYHPETEEPIYNGDMHYEVFAAFDVYRDCFQVDNNDRDWYIIKTYKNKYDLAAKYPEIAEEIIDLSYKNNDVYKMRQDHRFKNDELVPVYEFLHKQTPSVELGRRTIFLEGDLILEDGPLPYKQLPLYRIAQEDYQERPYGYTVAFDLLPLQEAVDDLYSTIITNQRTFGVQNILLPKGHNLTVDALGSGLNVLEYDSQAGKPEALNLTQTPVEIFNFITQIENQMQTISGINSVARGNPEASLKSGSALALVQSQAIAFNAVLQQSYIQLLQDVGTSTINILKDYAKTPRVVSIAGKSQRTLVQEFTGDDLDSINRVTIDVGNPLASTTAGKVQLAENLIANGMIKDPQQYIQVLTTGRLESVIEGEQAELLNIRAENEEMSIGNEVLVLATDSHRQHILEHKALLASPEARRNPQLIQLIAEHINQHINELANPENANLLMMLGQEPLGQPQQPMGDPSMEAMGDMPLDATNPVTGEAEAVNLPSMPTDPLTGEQYQAPIDPMQPPM